MIISCNNCEKKFDIDSILIPEKGRLLQCNSCNHTWFFKNETINEVTRKDESNKSNEKIIKPLINIEPLNVEKTESIELLDEKIKDNYVTSEISIKKVNKVVEPLEYYKSKDKKKYNILNYVIVFIVSFIAVIIVLDTFQGPISNIFPNIEFLLYNLYETIYDIVLFFKDLI